jgi:hypothetical protein
MQFPLAATFVDRASLKRIPGEIRVAVEQHMLLWTGWQYRSSDEDRAWDWWQIYLECQLPDGRYECYAVLTDNVLQGLMALDFKERKTGAGNEIIVDYLATNPANRMAHQGLKYIGIALVAVAIMRSTEQGANGRIRLESLPGAAGFYESLGMVKQPRRSTEGNSVYMLESKTAEELLAEITAQGIVKL